MATTSRNFAFKAYKAALQSPAVRGMVEAASELLTDAKIAQVNMRDAAKRDARWEGCAEAIQPSVDDMKHALANFNALRTLGAGHVE